LNRAVDGGVEPVRVGAGRKAAASAASAVVAQEAWHAAGIQSGRAAGGRGGKTLRRTARLGAQQIRFRQRVQVALHFDINIISSARAMAS